MKTRIIALALVVALLLAFGAAGCEDKDADTQGTSGTSNGGSDTPADPETPEVPDDPDAPEDDTVAVPDVIGMWPNDAGAALRAAGLIPSEVSVHGPMDEDAGDIGVVYRQTPAAGSQVAEGTTVEIRYWWESQ
jgi:hypothetical protein